MKIYPLHHAYMDPLQSFFSQICMLYSGGYSLLFENFSLAMYNYMIVVAT